MTDELRDRLAHMTKQAEMHRMALGPEERSPLSCGEVLLLAREYDARQAEINSIREVSEDKSVVIEQLIESKKRLQAMLDVAEEALKVCAQPGTYHLVGDIHEQGNYKAREALAHIADMKKEK